MYSFIQKNNLYTTKGGLLLKVDTIGDEVVYSNDTISVKEFSHIPSVQELQLAPSIKVESIRLWERIENLNQIPISPAFGTACGFELSFEWNSMILEKENIIFTLQVDHESKSYYIMTRSLTDGEGLIRRISYVADFQNVYRTLFLEELPINEQYIKEYGSK
jgi:hypothetical protein